MKRTKTTKTTITYDKNGNIDEKWVEITEVEEYVVSEIGINPWYTNHYQPLVNPLTTPYNPLVDKIWCGTTSAGTIQSNNSLSDSKITASNIKDVGTTKEKIQANTNPAINQDELEKRVKEAIERAKNDDGFYNGH